MAEGELRLYLRWANDVKAGSFRFVTRLGRHGLDATFTTQNKTTAWAAGEVGGTLGGKHEPLLSLTGVPLELSIWAEGGKQPVGTTQIVLDPSILAASITCEVALDAKECGAKADKGGSSWFSFRGKKEKSDPAAAIAAGEGKINDMPEPTLAGSAVCFQLSFSAAAAAAAPPTTPLRGGGTSSSPFTPGGLGSLGTPLASAPYDPRLVLPVVDEMGRYRGDIESAVAVDQTAAHKENGRGGCNANPSNERRYDAVRGPALLLRRRSQPVRIYCATTQCSGVHCDVAERASVLW